MTALSLIAWAAVIFLALIAALDAVTRWQARRRVRAIREEVMEIARQAGIPPEELDQEPEYHDRS